MSTETKFSLDELYRAYELEIARVSHVEGDSHEICKHFYSQLLIRLTALAKARGER